MCTCLSQVIQDDRLWAVFSIRVPLGLHCVVWSVRVGVFSSFSNVVVLFCPASVHLFCALPQIAGLSSWFFWPGMFCFASLVSAVKTCLPQAALRVHKWEEHVGAHIEVSLWSSPHTRADIYLFEQADGWWHSIGNWLSSGRDDDLLPLKCVAWNGAAERGNEFCSFRTPTTVKLPHDRTPSRNDFDSVC